MAFLGNYDSGAASGGKTRDHVAMASAPGAGELRPSVGRPSLGQSWGELPQTYQATSPNPREATRLRLRGATGLRQQGYCKEPLPTPPATATGRMLAKPGTEARPPKLCESAADAGYHGPVLLRPRFRIGERWHNEHRLHHLDGQYCLLFSDRFIPSVRIGGAGPRLSTNLPRARDDTLNFKSPVRIKDRSVLMGSFRGALRVQKKSRVAVASLLWNTPLPVCTC